VTIVREVATSRGVARLHVDDATSPRARLVLGHGAGGGVESPDLARLAHVLPSAGVDVWRVEQPWRVAGRRVAPAPSALDDAFGQVLRDVPTDVPLVLGGRSAGARVACRTAGALGASAVVALAFPLHPPGRPGVSRAGELDLVTAPMLVVQGERDPFGRPEEIPAGPARRVAAVPGDHALRADPDAVAALVVGFVLQVATAAAERG
jgi:hypothetical protein